jgi:hypothetical protein
VAHSYRLGFVSVGVKKKRGIPKQAPFLAAFCTCARIDKAAKAAKIDRSLHYRWLKEDADYPAAFRVASDHAAQTLEDEATRRANEGVLEPKFYQGEKCGSIRRYSDGLMQFLLSGLRPEKYGRRSLEVSGPAGGPIVVKNEALAKLSDDELAALLALAQKLAPENE